MQPRHRLVGDDRHPLAAQVWRNMRASVGQKPRTDQDVIGPPRQVNAHGLVGHALSRISGRRNRASITFSVVSSIENCGRVCTFRSAIA